MPLSFNLRPNKSDKDYDKSKISNFSLKIAMDYSRNGIATNSKEQQSK